MVPKLILLGLCFMVQPLFPGAGPGGCDPPEPAEVEFTVLDRKGYPAQWLRNKADESKLESEVIDWCES